MMGFIRFRAAWAPTELIDEDKVDKSGDMDDENKSRTKDEDTAMRDEEKQGRRR
jgi:hypothetical protein